MSGFGLKAEAELVVVREGADSRFQESFKANEGQNLHTVVPVFRRVDDDDVLDFPLLHRHADRGIGAVGAKLVVEVRFADAAHEEGFSGGTALADSLVVQKLRHDHHVGGSVRRVGDPGRFAQAQLEVPCVLPGLAPERELVLDRFFIELVGLGPGGFPAPTFRQFSQKGSVALFCRQNLFLVPGDSRSSPNK